MRKVYRILNHPRDQVVRSLDKELLSPANVRFADQKPVATVWFLHKFGSALFVGKNYMPRPFAIDVIDHLLNGGLGIYGTAKWPQFSFLTSFDRFHKQPLS